MRSEWGTRKRSRFNGLKRRRIEFQSHFSDGFFRVPRLLRLERERKVKGGESQKHQNKGEK